MLDFYQNIPLFVHPIAFSVGFFSVRWYSLCYLVGFSIVYLLLLWRVARGELRLNGVGKDLFDVTLFVFLASLIGGRLGYVLLYDPAYFIAHPLAVISPFAQDGSFVGLFGMSFFGALIGGIFALWFYCKKNKKSFWELADFIAPAIPAGYFFGRLGNFLNGELYGRVTVSPLGMHFANAGSALRWPSQLVEAMFEGLVLFWLLWSIRNNKKYAKRIGLLYVIGYALARFVAEFFREPDPQMQLLGGIFTFSQALSACSLVIALIFFQTLRKKGGVV